MKLGDATSLLATPQRNSAALGGRRLLAALAAAFACSIGTTLLTLGIYFYTAHEFGWGAALNMTLAAGQGVAYTLGALLANGVQKRFGARRSLIALHLMLGLFAGLAFVMPAQWQFVAILLIYVFVAAINWPMLESLVTAGADSHGMSRRVGLYNVVWASSSAAAVASAGWMIAHQPSGLFVVAVGSHVLGALFITTASDATAPGAPGDGGEPQPAPRPASAARQGVQPEPELLHARTLALWLSRIALPASYVINYALSALLPSLPVIKQLSPTMQTLCGSVWLAARFLSFVMLGKTVFWHARPRLLLVAAILMLGSFVGVTISPDVSREMDLAMMICSQVVLGVSLGMIYSASLYFGMVLSDGSTEHGGYHEALIGLGCIFGPGAGAVTQYLWPGDVTRAVIAVGGIVGICVLLAGVASVTIRPRE